MLFDTQKLDKFPVLPGVYLMKDSGGDVLYVGKAKNLRQRIKQYFGLSRDTRSMVPFLVAKIESIDTIVVTSEKEALLLENNLIKQHQPKYNALLKDDKTYVALKIDQTQQWPTISIVRYKGVPKDKALYFGPYLSAHAARETLDFLNKVFPLRQCSDQELARRVRPCVLFEMKRCAGPCAGKCTKEEYDEHLDKMIKFLKGQSKEVLQDLYDVMHRAADTLDFEKAALIQKRIALIEKMVEAQYVDKPKGSDADVIGLYRQGNELVVSQLFFRGGKLLGTKHYDFSKSAQEDGELLESFLLQNYGPQAELGAEIPREILLPVTIEQSETLAEILSTHQKRKVVILAPQRGEKLSLVEMANANAKATFEKDKDEKSIREKTLLEMQEKLRLHRYPRRIECFDNSHIQGMEPVAAMVAFTDGEKDTNRYRKYKIKTASASDDYGAMYEVLLRRYQRAREENDLPDLVIVDGGKGQLNMALKVFKELDIVSVDVIGLAKEQGRHDKGLRTEQIFLPEVKDPIFLKNTSSILFLIQKIRDEAHRAALTFHQKRRAKRTVASQVDEIPGIGPKRRKILLNHFGSVRRLKEATLEELKQVKGLTQANIEALQKFISHEGLTAVSEE